MSERDDEQIGRVLGRREVFRLLGLGGAAAIAAACATKVPEALGSAGPERATPAASTSAIAAGGVPGCVVKPALTEGPFFVDEKLDRSDIHTDPSGGAASAGVPLGLAFVVSKVDGTGCLPLEGVTVDVWHCDAAGRYSDEQQDNTVGKKFLRGYQTTDKDGKATFTTIYPGWYQGRTVHIHFKIRTADGKDFTSQLFFDDTLTDQVFAASPYKEKGVRDVRNANDSIFGESNGQLTLAPKTVGDGYEATFDVGLDLS
jgi:protocatechuate 3,4-dioxygenase beta subunit